MEKAFKEAHHELNFAQIDQIEQLNINPSELEQFVAEGEFATSNR